MSHARGWLRKMKITLDEGGYAHYGMVFKGQDVIPMDDWVGRHIQLEFLGAIRCVACDRPTQKSFSQGYCYLCSQSLAACDLCIMKPETCHFHQDTCREPEWGKAHCMIDHFVYLANTTGIKVGLTRTGQVPTRWLDQGAIGALPIFKAQTRRHAGFLEVLLANELNDKTNWRDLLRHRSEVHDLMALRKRLFDRYDLEIKAIDATLNVNTTRLEDECITIQYPMQATPQKVVSLNPLKQPNIEGVLLGIRGQYLMFEQGGLNLRKMSGHDLIVHY